MSVAVGGRTVRLTRREAVELRAALTECLDREVAYAHTTGRYRPDGSYVVARRGADSSGQRKVFESVAALRDLYRDLPDEFTARDLDRPDVSVSGGRRHLLVWHFVEHPAFDCDLVSRQPLTARKRRGGGDGATD